MDEHHKRFFLIRISVVRTYINMKPDVKQLALEMNLSSTKNMNTYLLSRISNLNFLHIFLYLKSENWTFELLPKQPNISNLSNPLKTLTLDDWFSPSLQTKEPNIWSKILQLISLAAEVSTEKISRKNMLEERKSE